MSSMAKIFGSMFGGNTQAPASPAQVQNNQQPQMPAPGNIPVTDQNPAMPNNPLVPAGSAESMNSTAKEEPKGLDTYNNLWEAPKEGEGPQTYESAFAKVTPENVNAFAQQKDFTKVVTPELLSKISAGGEEGTAAMMQALNDVSKAAYADTTASTISIVEAALTKQREQFVSALPGMLKQQNLSENLRNKNPIFDHPAAKPMLDMFMKQVALKNPNATVAEQTALAEKFIVDFAQAANPQKQTPAQKQQAANTKDDWSDFF